MTFNWDLKYWLKGAKHMAVGGRSWKVRTKSYSRKWKDRSWRGEDIGRVEWEENGMKPLWANIFKALGSLWMMSDFILWKTGGLHKVFSWKVTWLDVCFSTVFQAGCPVENGEEGNTRRQGDTLGDDSGNGFGDEQIDWFTCEEIFERENG